jgi:hypothetical protein
VLTLAINSDFEREAQAMRGTYANYSHCDFIIEEDASIFTPQGFFARFLPHVLSSRARQLALPVMQSVTRPVTVRGDAVGRGSLMPRIITKGLNAGRLSRTNEIPSSVQKLVGFSDQLGYLDAKKGTAKRGTDYCRPTLWTRERPEDLEAMMVAVNEVDLAFKEELPHLYTPQREIVQQARGFHLQGTSYSTLNLNRNWQTACHVDKYDLKNGWVALFALGNYTGGELIVPRYKVAFNLCAGDVLYFDPHQVHGNLPFAGERLTGLLFVREHIAACGGR